MKYYIFTSLLGFANTMSAIIEGSLPLFNCLAFHCIPGILPANLES